jgi:lysyl-tRNA synthetase, class I
VARRTPIGQGEAFKAIYRVLLDRDMGPRAGALMAVLERHFVVKRLTELPLDEAAFRRETVISFAEFMAVLTKDKAKIVNITPERWADDIADFTVTHDDAKAYLLRVRGSGPPSTDRSGSP